MALRFFLQHSRNGEHCFAANTTLNTHAFLRSIKQKLTCNGGVRQRGIEPRIVKLQWRGTARIGCKHTFPSNYRSFFPLSLPPFCIRFISQPLSLVHSIERVWFRTSSFKCFTHPHDFVSAILSFHFYRCEICRHSICPLAILSCLQDRIMRFSSKLIFWKRR